jgi:hypothetical protein
MAPQLPADFGDRRKDGDAGLGQRILRTRLKGRTRPGGFIASTRQIVNPRQTLPGFDPGQRQRGIACEYPLSLVDWVALFGRRAFEDRRNWPGYSLQA